MFSPEGAKTRAMRIITLLFNRWEYFIRGVHVGAKLLQGTDRSFVIAPMGSIIEERYTPYLQWLQPDSMSLE